MIRRALSMVVPLVVLATACGSREPDGLALIGATLIDGRGGAPQTDMVIVVRGHRIESVTKRDGFEIPDRTLKVNATGKYVMPGLIDAHAHATRWALSRYLGYGVTSVRDMHGQLDTILALREEASLNAFPSPRIYAAGAMLDGAPATYRDALESADNAAARKAVDRLAVAGADYIKVFTHITPQMLRAILDEANTFGLRVTAHLGLTDAVTAANLGVRAIEHMSGVPEAAVANAAPLYAAHGKSYLAGWSASERTWASLDSVALSRVAKQLVQHNVILVPTLVLHDTYSQLDDPAVLQGSWLAAVPDSVRAAWNLPQMVAQAGWTPADYATFRRGRPVQDLFLREFLRAGGVLAVGTDASNPMLVPGFSEHTELELLVNAGLSPADALLAATHDAAVLLGADSIGEVAPGKVADLLVLDRNPLDDIRNSRSIEQVVLRGQLFDADSIRKHW